MKTFRPITSNSRKSTRNCHDSEALRSVKRQSRALETEMKKLEAHILEVPLLARERRAMRLDTVPALDDLGRPEFRPFGKGSTRQVQAQMRAESMSNFLGFAFMLVCVVGLCCWLWAMLRGV